MSNLPNSKLFIPIKYTYPNLFLGIFESIQDWQGKSMLDKISIVDFTVDDDNFTLHLNVEILGETVLEIPGLDAVKIIFGDLTQTIIPFKIDIEIFDQQKIKIIDLEPRLLFSSEFFKPVKLSADGQTFVPDPIRKPEISLGSYDLQIDSEGGIDFIPRFGNEEKFSLNPIALGDTGFVLEASEISISLNPNSSLQEKPIGWRGCLIKKATIHLPDNISVILPNDVQLEIFSIGSDGFSGSVLGQWTPQLSSDQQSFTGNGAGNIFDIPIALKKIDLEFKQNIFVKSKIDALVILPFFDQPISCEIRFTVNGDFTVGVSSDQSMPSGIPTPNRSEDGLFIFTKQDLLTLKLKSLEFKKENSKLEISLGGSIKPLFGGIDWPEVEIDGLSIDSKGNVKLDGGWISTPGLSSDFHGFILELSKIGFGQDQDGWKWIGLSGVLNIVEGIPLRGAVEGLKIIWKGSDVRLQISGIDISFEVEKLLDFRGKVFFVDEDDKKGFKGGVNMVLYPLDGMSLDAEFMAGRNTITPPYNFFYVYLGVGLPIGIPIGSTGLSLYGIDALFGSHSKIDKRDNENWFENDDGTPGLYKRDTPGITPVEKWTDKRDALALGAGITIGTAADNGFAVSAKALLVFLVPGPVILVEGKASFLKERAKINDDPPYKMLAVFDTSAGTFLMNIDASYVRPDDGKIVRINGGAESFFSFNDPNSWHVYLGQKHPESKRIRALFLGIFNANAFLMINKNGILLGASIKFDKGWRLGKLRISLKASIIGEFGLSWKPLQAAGSLVLRGDVKLRAFGKGLTLSVYAGMAVKTPTPWFILAKFKVKLKTPWPLPNPKAKITLKWEHQAAPPWPLPLANVGIEHHKVSEKWILEKSRNYDTNNDGFVNNFAATDITPNLDSAPIIPLDARPVLTFARPVEDGPTIGDNARFTGDEIVGDYKYRYRIKSVTLKKKEKNNLSSWETVAQKTDGDSSDTVSDALYGMWQALPDSSSQINTKLMLWADTPFEISRELESNEIWLGPLLAASKEYPCDVDTTPKLVCVNFDNVPNKSKTFSPFLIHDGFVFFSLCKMEIASYNKEEIQTNTALQITCGKIKPGTPASSEGGLVTIDVGNSHTSHVEERGDNMGDTHANSESSVSNVSRIFNPNSPGNAFESNLSEYFLAETQMNKIGNLTKTHAHLLVTIPQEMAKVQIYFSEKSHGTIEMYDKSNAKIATTEFDMSEHYPRAYVELHVPDKKINALRIYGDFGLIQICCITEDEMNRILTSEQLLYHQKEAIVQHWGRHSAAVLEPNKYYQLEVVTETRRSKRNSNNWETHTFTESAYFQTENPPGAYVQSLTSSELSTTQEEHYPQRGPLREIGPYVMTTIPKQTASNEPQKLHYRSDDVGITFNESYFAQMYLMASLPLKIRFFNNNDQEITDADGNLLIVDNHWIDNPQLILTREENQWKNLVENRCNYVFGGEHSHNHSQSIIAGSKKMVLDPQTFYKAKMFAGNFSIFEIAFVTSKYSSFLHHIHSFADVMWNYKRLNPELVSPLLDSDLGLRLDEEELLPPTSVYEPTRNVTEEESIKFERLAKRFKFGIRQLPSQLEIMEINDDQFSYGLLLESPQPFDWERMILRIKSTHSDYLLEESQSQIKIIDAKINAPANTIDFNQEWVDVLILKTLPPSTITIQHRPLADPENGNFYDYFTLNNDKTIPAGTVLRIHSGTPPENIQHPQEYDHMYPDASRGLHFDSSGEILRAVDAQSNILHQRVFKDFVWSNESFVIIRNKDQTRAFVFFMVGDGYYGIMPAPANRLKFEFIYKRENFNDKPELTHMGGISANEVASIEFNLPSQLPEIRPH